MPRISEPGPKAHCSSKMALHLKPPVWAPQDRAASGHDDRMGRRKALKARSRPHRERDIGHHAFRIGPAA